MKTLLLVLLPSFLLAESPVESMRVEGRSGWIVTDDEAPRLEWTPADPNVAKWELQTSTAEEGFAGAKAWNPDPFSVTEGPWKVWHGAKLTNGTKVRWRVRGIDKNGKASAWSKEQKFERGIPGLWQTDWIAMPPAKRGDAAVCFRKEFQWDGQSSDARLYISGLGYHEAWLNGTKLGKGVLEPGQTDYGQRVFYLTHKIDSHLKDGTNVLAVRIGDGFFNQNKVWGPKGMSYGQPRLNARLVFTKPDGKKHEVSTDPTWKCQTGAILFSNIYHGEIHDARLALKGWRQIDFDDSQWLPAIKVPAPGGKMEAQSLPSIIRHSPLATKTITEPENGIQVFDFGQNFTGWCRLSITAPPGTKVSLTFAERLGEDGRVDTLSTGTIHTKSDQRDVYICRGGGREIWEPSFSWHGFQFVEVQFENGAASDFKLEGIPVHTELPIRGKFNCSDPLINRLLDTAHWTQVSNVLSLPMDCPARERCGWTGDAHLCVPFTMYRYDSGAMWRKFIWDMRTTAERTQPMLTFGKGMGDRKVRPKARGIPTMVAPGKRFIGEASPDWGSAMVFIPWDLYQFSGDLRILSRNLAPMRQWTQHVADLVNDEGIVYAGLGDWCRPWPSTGEQAALATRGEARDYYGEVIPMLSTACLFRCADIMAKVEELFEEPGKSAYWQALAEKTREAFFLAMEQHEGWTYQTIMAIAIEWGLAPADRKQEIANRLAAQVEKDGNHFMTGVFGAPSLWPALADYGHEETAYSMLHIETAPSFRYLFAQGATSYWEVWPGEVDKGKRWERSMSHPFQGAFAHWFYSGLAGIRNESPGFQNILLKPTMSNHLTQVDCRFRSAMGWIESSWTREDNTMTWTIEIPLGATAKVIAPGSVETWTQNGVSRSLEDFEMLPSGRHILKVSLK